MVCRCSSVALVSLLAARAAAVLGFTSNTLPVGRRSILKSRAPKQEQAFNPHRKLQARGSLNSDDDKFFPFPDDSQDVKDCGNAAFTSSLIALTAMAALPDGAFAVGGSDIAVPSALVAYAHYSALLVSTAAIITEWATVSTDMSPEQEKTLLYADVINQVALLAIGWSGYLRVMEYGKGWEFYCHEPLFWIKVSFFGIVEATSLFPTIHIAQRALAQRSAGGGTQPHPAMSEALVARMKQLMRAELHSLLTIPIVATFMARGVFYVNDFPWQAGAALVAATLAGSTFRYSREALTWANPPDSQVSIAVATNKET